MTKDHKFRSAVKWAYLMNWGEQGFTAVVTFVLASLLGPRDFGTVAMAMVYVLFIQMFLDQGLVAALIQRKDLKDTHLDSVFWLVAAVSAVLVALSIGLSGWWGRVNDLPELAAVINVLSLTIPIQGLTLVQRAFLQREMDFRSLSLRSNLSVLVGGAVGIGMAILGYGVWALVGQQVAKSLASLLTLWKLSHWRPRLRFHAPSLSELMSFSLANFLGKIGVFFNRQSDALLMGLFFGPVAVGLYRLAERIVDMCVTVATRSLQSVSFPQFSKLQDKPEELRRSVLSCIRLGGIVTLPVLAGLAVTSDLLMGVLGDKWLPGTGALQVLCLYGILFGFSQFFGPLLQALGRPMALAVLMWLVAGLGVGGLVVAAALLQEVSTGQQALGIATVRLVLGALLFLILLVVIRRYSQISSGAFLRTIRPSLFSAILIVTVVLLLRLFLGTVPPVPALVLTGGAGFVVGVSTLLWLDDGLRKALSDLRARLFPGRELTDRAM